MNVPIWSKNCASLGGMFWRALQLKNLKYLYSEQSLARNLLEKN